MTRRRGRGREADVSPEVLLAAGYAAFLLAGRVGARVAVGAHAPALAALPHRRLHLRRATTTTGTARRASTCGRTSSTTSAASCATARRRTSATAARARTPAPTPTQRARDRARRSTRGRTRRPAASTAALSLLLVALAVLVLVVAGARAPRAAEAALLLALAASPALIGRLAAARLPRASRELPGADRSAWTATRDDRRRRTPRAEPLDIAEPYGRGSVMGRRERQKAFHSVWPRPVRSPRLAPLSRGWRRARP